MKGVVSNVLLGCLAMLSVPVAFAQETSATPELLPRAITVSLTMPNARPVKLMIKEGAMARLTRVADDTILAIAPTVLDEDAGIVTAQVFRVTRGLGDREILTPIGDIEIRRFAQTDGDDRGAPRRAIRAQGAEATESLFGMHLTLQSITSTSEQPSANARCAAPKSDFSIQPHGPCSTCCVTCDGWRFCGCAVEASCGSCCCTACC